ncbi:putative iron reductase domain protein [Durotheca rogersii]|uniref:putative iron reductase domain protein n=1 Tax=Durotheca rogersii TaxID=419775 RepID=UPI0022203CA9|nr:putative iron reductase domain protein [Durotheca rogersii]KAI5859766.1 putative iron reductase domain protein [Durotheca rogersii]
MKTCNILSQLGLAVLISLSLFTTVSRAQAARNTSSSPNAGTAAGSVFITPTRNLAFALNVPDDSATDLYFSLMIPMGVSWGAVGLGSDRMAGALVLVAYPSASGQNVTLSPRLAFGHSEPEPAPEIEVEALPGTGLDANGTTYVFHGRCANCRVWPGGSVDVASAAQSMLYATGQSGNYLKSDAVDAPLRMHSTYGTFTLDMVRATGPAGVPAVDRSADSPLVSTTQGLAKEGKRDVAALAHAVIMCLVFAGLYPFGMFVLRLGNWVRWHGVNQALALVFVVVGSSLGFAISGSYNRSRKFNTAHQAIGLLVFLFTFVQFALGFLHHRNFSKTKQPTKMAPVHVWLGRAILLFGVINGFLGFPLAQASQYSYVLAGLILFVFPALILVLVTKKFIQKRWSRSKGSPSEAAGYAMEPWQPPAGAQGLPGQNASLPPSSSYRPHHTPAARPDLSPQQNAREYV